MPRYRVSDEWNWEEIEAADEREAEALAQEWILDGDCGEYHTRFCRVVVGEVDEAGEYVGSTFDVRCVLPADEPPCTGRVPGRVHRWDRVCVVGNGAGVLIEDDCEACGWRRFTDTWASAPWGEQGLESVSYQRAELP